MPGKGCKNVATHVRPLCESVKGAWFYENPKSLDVFVEVLKDNGEFYKCVSVRIPRAKVADWLARTECA